MDLVKISSYAAIAMPALFIIALWVALSHNPWFSFRGNALSDMGSLHNPARVYFNGSLIVMAVFGLLASLGAFKSGLSYLMPAAMVSLVLVGVFPEELPYHTPAAVAFYALALGDIFIIGLRLGLAGMPSGFAWASLSVLAFIAIICLIGAKVFRGLAIPELIGAAVILAWFVYVGLLMLGKPHLFKSTAVILRRCWR